MSDFPVMRPLKFWTQKILPLIYDDSISYLEMLGKVKTKLNELIEYYNGLKDVIPQEAQDLYEGLAKRLEDDLDKAIRDLNDALTADIGDLNDAKADGIEEINGAVSDGKGTIDDYALTAVQQLIADYDSALAPLLTPSATATTLQPGENPTASYNNGVFTFGLPGSEGDMTVAEYGGSAPGVVAEADNAASLGDNPASAYMLEADYTGAGTEKVNQAENATTAQYLGDTPATGYMKKADYTGNGVQLVNMANNSMRLGNQPASYYAPASVVQSMQNDIAALQGQISSADIVQLKEQVGNLTLTRASIPAGKKAVFTFRQNSTNYSLVCIGTPDLAFNTNDISVICCPANQGFEERTQYGDLATLTTLNHPYQLEVIPVNPSRIIGVGIFSFFGWGPTVSIVDA